MFVGRTIQSVERRGKFLRILLDGLVLVSHLRMEGRYGVYEQGEPVELHTHVRFHFTDGTELRYKDVCQFGTMHLFEPGEEFVLPPLNKLGLSRWTMHLRCSLSRKRSLSGRPKSNRSY